MRMGRGRGLPSLLSSVTCAQQEMNEVHSRPCAVWRAAASFHRCQWTHLEKLTFLSTLTAEVSENTALVLQKIPRRTKLNNSAVIKDKDPGFRVSCLFCRWFGCSARPAAIIRPETKFDY